jgi:hypothetical protein
LVFSVSGLWNRTDRFFQNFNRFFSRFGFFDYFFPDFLGLIGFLVFLLTHIYIYIYIYSLINFLHVDECLISLIKLFSNI